MKNVLEWKFKILKMDLKFLREVLNCKYSKYYRIEVACFEWKTTVNQIPHTEGWIKWIEWRWADSGAC